MRKMTKAALLPRLLALFLCLACLCACAPPPITELPADWVFSELPFVAPDTRGLIARAEKLSAKLEKNAPTAEDLAAFEEMERDFALAHSRCAQAYVLRCRDMTDMARERSYTAIEDDLNEVDALLTGIAAALIAGEGGGFSTHWPSAKKEDYKRAGKLSAPILTADLRRESALVNAYDKLESGFSVRYAERDWTMADILAAEGLPYTELFALLQLYEKQYADAAGSIYYELALLRRGIAETMGYNSYTQYRYDAYCRDYTPQEADALCSAVKAHFVPLHTELVKAYANDLKYLYGATFPQVFYWERIQTAIAQALPSLVPAWNYMELHELFDLRVDANKRAGSFTTYISEYRAPFLYTHWNDSAAAVGTTIHEFGHFARCYFMRDSSESATHSLDLCEVDSQGLEMLLLPWYDTVYARHAHAAEISALTDALFAVISGCMEDEFERKIYDAPAPLSVAEMNGVYLSLANEYGLTALYGYKGTEWMDIPHHYQAPLYYISYATSMLAALGLWETAQENPHAAQKAYLSILQRNPHAAFRCTLVTAGQCDPLSPARVKELAERVKWRFGET